MKRVILQLGVALLLTSATINAQAASINYGDFAGDTVTYIQVTEASGTDAVPLYGSPTVSGDSLDFDPVFTASASGAGGYDQTDGQLLFDVYAQSGSIVEGLKFCEAGDFSLVGAGTDFTMVDVTATFYVDVYEVDGVGIDVVSKTVTMTFSPNADGTFAMGTDGGGGPFYDGIWEGCVEIDLLSLLDDNAIDYTYGATKVSVNLDNKLVALSEDGTSAYIAKKNFNGFSVTTIPEPASFTLLGTTVAGAFFVRRRLLI